MANRKQKRTKFPHILTSVSGKFILPWWAVTSKILPTGTTVTQCWPLLLSLQVFDYCRFSNVSNPFSGFCSAVTYNDKLGIFLDKAFNQWENVISNVPLARGLAFPVEETHLRVSGSQQREAKDARRKKIQIQTNNLFFH